MFDCHVHVFPDFIEVGKKFGKGFALGAMPKAKSVGAKIIAKIPMSFPDLPIDIESIWELRKLASGPVSKVMDVLLSFGIGPQILFRGNLDRLKDSMSKNAIKHAVVIAGPPFSNNKWLFSAIVKERALFTLVAHLPKAKAGRSRKEWMQLLEGNVEEGAKGLKIHTNLDGLEAGDVAYKAVFQVAQSHGLFVILHTGCFHMPNFKNRRPANPDDFVPYFEKYPDVKVCLAHMNRDHPQVVIDLMKRFPQLFTDTSWQPSHAIANAIKKMGSSRILLGSDWPLLHGDLQKNAIETLQRATTDSQFEQITMSNPKEFLAAA